MIGPILSSIKRRGENEMKVEHQAEKMAGYSKQEHMVADFLQTLLDVHRKRFLSEGKVHLEDNITKAVEELGEIAEAVFKQDGHKKVLLESADLFMCAVQFLNYMPEFSVYSLIDAVKQKRKRLEIGAQVKRPKTVVLCGSTRFKDAFAKANFLETMAGNMVLSVGFFHHSGDYQPSEDEKKALDELHLRKIDRADEVLVIDVNGYIGSSTSNEIKYAKASGKSIRYWSKTLVPDSVSGVGE